MCKAGGEQDGASVAIYDNSGAEIAQTAANTADSGFTAKTADGSVNVIIKDEGMFDLYSTLGFQQTAIANYTTFVATTDPYATSNISPYAQVDPYAKVSSLAIVEPYAVIDAYAVVDDYAVIGAYAQIGSYAYIAANVDIYTGIDQYSQVTVDAYADVTANITAPTTFNLKSGGCHVSATFAVTTTPPELWLRGRTGDGDGESSGGLHCMTSGLATQGLILFGILIATLLVRRKRN